MNSGREKREKETKMKRPVSFACTAALFAFFVFWGAAHAQTALTADEARTVVAPLYDALNQPAKKDVATLLEKAAGPSWLSCGSNDQCAPRACYCRDQESRRSHSRSQMGDQGADRRRQRGHRAGGGVGHTGRA